MRELEPQKGIEEVRPGPYVGGSGWRLAEQAGAWFPYQELGQAPFFSAPQGFST